MDGLLEAVRAGFCTSLNSARSSEVDTFDVGMEAQVNAISKGLLKAKIRYRQPDRDESRRYSPAFLGPVPERSMCVVFEMICSRIRHLAASKMQIRRWTLPRKVTPGEEITNHLG
ncbi:hypothetical protein [Paraburkholderia youngii]|uniref:hypothetical protein n=1 Tax=Paraburkholderia youngii TaxID=2782701 RepID=UPI003D19B770